jgi:carbon-monoxide dehydrogenase large subunit
LVAVDDFGNIINPMIVEGQVHGGIAQGVGQALLEGAHLRQDGQLVTASFMDYAMPRADDLPSFKVGMTVTPCPSNPLGIKGCGEAGAIARRPRSSTRSPMPSGTRTCRCRRRRGE